MSEKSNFENLAKQIDQLKQPDLKDGSDTITDGKTILSTPTYKRSAAAAKLTPVDDGKRTVFMSSDNANLNQTINELREKIVQLNTRVSYLEGILNTNDFPALTKNTDTWSKRISSNQTTKLANSVAKELGDRDSRRTSLIMFGVTETNEDVEWQNIKNILQCLGIVNVNFQYHRFKRKTSSNPDRPTPLRVTFETEDIRNKILYYARKLKNSSFSNTYIQADLTPAEQAAARELRAERDQRNIKL